MNSKLSISALAGLVLGGSVVYALVDGKQVEIEKPLPATPVLLAHAEEQCVAELRDGLGNYAPHCEKCTTELDGKKDVAGWCCDGVFVPRRLADCLDAAKAEVEKPLPKPEPEPEPIGDVTEP